MDIITEIRVKAARRQQILDNGVPLAELQEYETLTLFLAQVVPYLLKALEGERDTSLRAQFDEQMGEIADQTKEKR